VEVTSYQLFAVASAVFAVLGGGYGAWRLRGVRRFSVRSVVISAAGPAISLVLYLVVTDLALTFTATVVVLSLGALVGLAAGASRPALGTRSGVVVARGGTWLPLPSVAAIAAVQLGAAFGSRTVFVIALAALELSVAFGIGAAAAVLARRLLTRPARAATVIAGSSRSAPVATTPMLYCPQCGTRSSPGWRYCAGCGSPLPT
jgi:hypothetical protein